MVDEDPRRSAEARSRELEEACDFAGAARAAQEALDLPRAARLAALSGDSSLIDATIAAIAATGPELAMRVGEDLLARGQPAAAARLLASAGEDERAGAAFAAAGAPVEAARAFERAGRPGEGAKALDAALRANADDHQARRALGELLARHGRVEGAVKALQALPRGSEERARGLPLLARSLRALGLEEAAREVDAELAAAGGPRESSPPSSPIDAPKSAAPARPVLFGRFEVRQEIAQTPHARLVLAFDRVGRREVAVKLLATGPIGAGRDVFVRFEREARALAQLRHPSIVPLVAYLPEGPAMALEWMPGGSLAELMSREQIAPARAVEITCAVLGALGVAHRLGILHRDVKPSNVLFDAIGSPRLADFGAAHLGDGQNTATAGAIGTFAYMSPEQRLGRPATVKSDVYAAGALLYEMITGAPAEPLAGAAFEDLPPSAFHPDLDAAHDGAIAAMLAQDPARRPLDTFEARKGLEALTWPADVVPRAGPTSSRTRTSVPPPSRPERLGPPLGAEDGDPRRAHDAWTGRDVLVIPADAAELARARAFARASHDALPLVLRASPAEGTLWVEAPRGRSWARGAPRSRDLLALLEEAVEQLHAAGGAHGSLGDAAVFVDDEGFPHLAYPALEPDPADADADRAALRALAVVVLQPDPDAGAGSSG